ncbi:MAG: dehydrogenase E1 component subunit alpha/beta [Planctomycetota bacterium]|jgi:2-oxoisovalerate dehydrogenase E1 component|nr:dehydrogenase E1 component subunit alpha/beta [Planctomycetota bacterium]MDP7251141.1 dehydrogenase E1 component subunit alpha/beta [Planctomycetota bacterium]
MPVAIDSMPVFEPGEITFKTIPLFQTRPTLEELIEQGVLNEARCLELLEQMLAIRIFEEMIYALRLGAYEPLRGFEYRGPTHLSIGQEATSVGGCAAIEPGDYITSTHRGHGDGIAKGFTAIAAMSDEQLKARLGSGLGTTQQDEQTTHEDLLEEALEDHIFRTIAELFGKEDGYCKGRGGGMHIADFSVGHLGANAIVGGSTGIAAGAGFSSRYRESGQVTLSFVGDGAYANGITLESMNLACMAQFSNPQLTEKPFGIPTIFTIINNMYAMTGQQQGEISGVDYLARRAAAFDMDCMHAEVVNGMDLLSVLASIHNAATLCKNGDGPVVRELITYRYYGHSLSDPGNEYRRKEEEQAWRDIDPITNFEGRLIEAGLATDDDLKALREKVQARQDRAATRAAAAPDPVASELTRYVFTELTDNAVPEWAQNPKNLQEPERTARDADGQISFKEAIREALIEEMVRDKRVIFYGEDVADYGGAFKVTKGLLEAFGRDRVFNTSISEAGIIGTGVGCAMTELRPIVELMYSDFEFQASDQLCNQAAKWSFMSGGKTAVPLVLRTSQGAGKGYGGQHSQAMESHSTHTPGLKVVIPSTAYDAKGLLKTAIRDNDPVVFVENQNIYNEKCVVPEEEYLIPFGEADIKRAGKHLTIVAWSFLLHEALAAAETLSEEGIESEVIDPRTLIPLDLETIVESVRKTGRLMVVSQACKTGSYTGEVAAQIQEAAFDYLDAPICRLGAADGISPQSHVLERAFLPYADTVADAARKLCEGLNFQSAAAGV